MLGSESETVVSSGSTAGQGFQTDYAQAILQQVNWEVSSDPKIIFFTILQLFWIDLKIWEKYQAAGHLVILKPWPAAGHLATANNF